MSHLVGTQIVGYLKHRLICKISVSEFEELYRQEETYDVAHQQFEFCATFSYDHIWVAALALNCTETFLRDTGRLWFLL